MVVIKKVDLKKRGLGVLSPMETDVIKILWKNPRGMKVRNIYEKLKTRRKVVLTSTAVILDRLHSKKLVKREIEFGRGGDHYIYTPVMTENDFQKSVIDGTVNNIIEKFGPSAVSYFNERFGSKKSR